MRACRFVARCVTVMLALCAPIVGATPYRPASDNDIVESLPAGAGSPADRATRALRAAVARDPENIDLALRLASLYVARARIESDPRPLGRAEATLAPWWNAPEPPVPVLVLRATIEQSGHAFDDARADLARALAREPANAQAWLTLATVQQVTGDLAGAGVELPAASRTSRRRRSRRPARRPSMASAAALPRRSTRLIACVPKRLSTHGPDATLATWATTLQAELAERARPAGRRRTALSREPRARSARRLHDRRLRRLPARRAPRSRRCSR